MHDARYCLYCVWCVHSNLSVPDSMKWHEHVCKEATEGLTLIHGGRYVRAHIPFPLSLTQRRA